MGDIDPSVASLAKKPMMNRASLYKPLSVSEYDPFVNGKSVTEVVKKRVSSSSSDAGNIVEESLYVNNQAMLNFKTKQISIRMTVRR
jgi:hypothetical protein